MTKEEAAKKLQFVKQFYTDMEIRKALDMGADLLGETNAQCKGCAYNGRKMEDGGCEAFTERPEHCWNHTTTKQKAQRIAIMKEYAR